MASIVIHWSLGMRFLNPRDGLSLDHLKQKKGRGVVMKRTGSKTPINTQLEVIVLQLLVSMKTQCKEPAMK